MRVDSEPKHGAYRFANRVMLAATAAATAWFFAPGANNSGHLSSSLEPVQDNHAHQEQQKYFADFEMSGIKVELSSIEEITQPDHSGMKTISVYAKASEDPISVGLHGWSLEIAAGGQSYEGTLVVIPSSSTDSLRPGFDKNYPVDIRINALVPDYLSGYRLDVSYRAPVAEGNDGGVGDSSKSIPLSSQDVTPVPVQDQPPKA